jgi:hypothetical protein
LIIIKNNLNYVFGGYTAAKWSSNVGWTSDSTAFIFSLRRAGISNSQKFEVKRAQYAIYSKSGHFIKFGDDLEIKERSDKENGSNTDIGTCYECPKGYLKGNEDTKSFLAGSYNSWLTTEIEIYRMNKD